MLSVNKPLEPATNESWNYSKILKTLEFVVLGNIQKYPILNIAQSCSEIVLNPKGVIYLSRLQKMTNFVNPHHLHLLKWTRDLLFNQNNRICKHVTNVKSPSQPPFLVEAINVWSQSTIIPQRISFFKRCSENYVLSYLISIFC